MLQEYLFVSCDIVAHSAQTLQIQVERVEAINRIIGSILSAGGQSGLIWASGGDGGHVALPPGSEVLAIQLILALSDWSISKSVPLRISANLGNVECLEGADGRKQLVGQGINLAGSLIPLAGPTRVIVSLAFRDRVKPKLSNEFVFHDERLIQFRKLPAEPVCLLSLTGRFQSRWEESVSDRILLNRALEQGDALSVVYRVRRLFETNPKDQQALDALNDLAFKRSLFVKGEGFIESLFMDERLAPELMRASALVERRAGETLCESDDQGETMFWILMGQLAGFRTTLKPGNSPFSTKPDFIMKAGELAGELAFALRRRRTAALYCLVDSTFLAFHYEQLLSACAQLPTKGQVKETLDGKINARIVENVWRVASCFAGSAADLLVKLSSPWSLLVAYSTRGRLSWEDQEIIGPNHSFFEPKTVCILISGQVNAHWNPDLKLDGVDYPILFVDLPGKPLRTAGTFELLGNIDLLKIRCEGLQALGISAYKEIVKQMTGQVNKQTLPIAQSAGKVEEPTQTTLDLWRERLGFFQKQEATTTDAEQKFALSKQIQEAKAKISELGG